MLENEGLNKIMSSGKALGGGAATKRASQGEPNKKPQYTLDTILKQVTCDSNQVVA